MQAVGIEGQVATMLESHTRQIGTTAIKRARKNNQGEAKQKSRLGTASNEITVGGGGLQLVCGRPTLLFSSALVPQTLSFSVAWKTPKSSTHYHRKIEIKIKTKLKQT